MASGVAYGLGVLLLCLAAGTVTGVMVWAATVAAGRVRGQPPPRQGPPPLPPGWDPPTCPFTGRPQIDHPAYQQCRCGYRHVTLAPRRNPA